MTMALCSRAQMEAKTIVDSEEKSRSKPSSSTVARVVLGSRPRENKVVLGHGIATSLSRVKRGGMHLNAVQIQSSLTAINQIVHGLRHVSAHSHIDVILLDRKAPAGLKTSRENEGASEMLRCCRVWWINSYVSVTWWRCVSPWAVYSCAFHASDYKSETRSGGNSPTGCSCGMWVHAFSIRYVAYCWTAGFPHAALSESSCPIIAKFNAMSWCV